MKLVILKVSQSGHHWLVSLIGAVKSHKLSKTSVNSLFFTDFHGLQNGRSFFSQNIQRPFRIIVTLPILNPSDTDTKSRHR